MVFGRLYIRTTNYEGQAVHWFLFNDYEFQYQAARFLNRFLIYETVDVHNDLHFY